MITALFGKKRITEEKLANVLVNAVLEMGAEGFPLVVAELNEATAVAAGVHPACNASGYGLWRQTATLLAPDPPTAALGRHVHPTLAAVLLEPRHATHWLGQDPSADCVWLTDRMQQAMAFAQSNGTKLALMIIDLDRFKVVNDSLGHLVGDELLRGISSRLRD